MGEEDRWRPDVLAQVAAVQAALDAVSTGLVEDHARHCVIGGVRGFCDSARVSELGYARVSTADQGLALQVDGLKAAGCQRVFSETASGARSERPAARAPVGGWLAPVA